MKLEYLQKIISRIQNQIHCPKCKAPFEQQSIEIRAVKGQQVEFSAECSHCNARSQISAEIGHNNTSTRIASPIKKPLSGFEIPMAHIQNTDLSALSASLKSFKSDDVKKLFE